MVSRRGGGFINRYLDTIGHRRRREARAERLYETRSWPPLFHPVHLEYLGNMKVVIDV
jgi:hypothetical protein